MAPRQCLMPPSSALHPPPRPTHTHRHLSYFHWLTLPPAGRVRAYSQISDVGRGFPSPRNESPLGVYLKREERGEYVLQSQKTPGCIQYLRDSFKVIGARLGRQKPGNFPRSKERKLFAHFHLINYFFPLSTKF